MQARRSAGGSGAPGEPVPAWTILRAEDFPLVQPGASPQRGKRVYFQLWNGETSYVELPLSSFSPDAVRRAIEDHAGDLADVLQLEGPQVQLPG